MKFEIIVPTYKRVAKLQHLLDSIRNTIGNRMSDISLFLQFDNNDYESCDEMVRQGLLIGFYRVNYSVNNSRKLVFGIWNDHMQKHFDGDAVIVLADDVEFKNKGLQFVMEDFEKNCADTDWVMALNQKDPGHCASFVVIGRKFADRFSDRTCFYPEYKVCAGDNELWQFARYVKRAYLNTSEVVIAHNHTTDQVDREGKREFLMHDKELFNERQAQGLLWGKN